MRENLDKNQFGLAKHREKSYCPLFSMPPKAKRGTWALALRKLYMGSQHPRRGSVGEGLGGAEISSHPGVSVEAMLGAWTPAPDTFRP